MKKFIAKMMAFVMLITALPLFPLGGIQTAMASVPFTVHPGLALERSGQIGDPNPVIPINPTLDSGKALLQWQLDNVNNYTLQYSLAPGQVVTLQLDRVDPQGATAYRVSYSLSTPPALPDYQIWHIAPNGDRGFVPIALGAQGPYAYFNVSDPLMTTPSLNHSLTAPTNPVFTITQGQGFTFRYAQREVSFFWVGNTFYYSIGDTRNESGQTSVTGLNKGMIYEFALGLTGSAAPPTLQRVLPELDITSIPTAARIATPNDRIDISEIIDYIPDSIAYLPGIRITIKQPSFLRADGTTPALSAGAFGNIIANINLIDAVNQQNNID
jgi:hypothetical protein